MIRWNDRTDFHPGQDMPLTSIPNLLRRLCLAAALTFAAASGAAAAQPDLAFPGATGGILRFPNTNQDDDRGNAFAEVWVKQGMEFWRSGTTKAQVFYLGNIVRDSHPYPWNNAIKHGLGIQLSTRPTDHLELTFSARHDWYREFSGGAKKQGWKLAVDYYYYRSFPGRGALWGMPNTARVFKSYGTLAWPGSLEPGDRNLVLTLGGEYSAEFGMGDETPWLFVPFVDLHMAWDRDRNSYNTKVIPAAGVKLRKPFATGELFAGAKIEADHRPIDGTLRTGPMVFAGWYRGW